MLLTFWIRRCEAWWYQTGTPKWLIEPAAAGDVAWHDPEGALASDELLSTLDVEEEAPNAVLFQSECLTVRGLERIDGHLRYRLGFPNREVRESLNRALLKRLTGWPSCDLRCWDDRRTGAGSCGRGCGSHAGAVRGAAGVDPEGLAREERDGEA